MAAHMMYTTQAMSAEQLSPAQMFFIGLLEDARVEYKAVNEFPGLKKLWRSLIMLEHEEPAEHKTMSILEGFALQLLDEDARGSDEQLNKFATKFHQKIEANQDDNHFAWLSSSYTRMVSLQVQITCASSPANSQSTSCAIIKGNSKP
jgi:hypothetical protein